MKANAFVEANFEDLLHSLGNNCTITVYVREGDKDEYLVQNKLYFILANIEFMGKYWNYKVLRLAIKDHNHNDIHMDIVIRPQVLGTYVYEE